MLRSHRILDRFFRVWITVFTDRSNVGRKTKKGVKKVLSNQKGVVVINRDGKTGEMSLEGTRMSSI